MIILAIFLNGVLLFFVIEPIHIGFWRQSQATQEVVSKLPLTTDEEFRAAVQSAKSAFPKWRNTPITARQRVMFKLQELIRRDMVVTAACVMHYN